MRSSYKRIGDYIQLIDERNRDLSITTLLGLSIDKVFIPSVANTVGSDMANYKVIRKGQFACSLMQVRRDKKIPVAMLNSFEEAIISQAYPVFEIVDTEYLLPEYLMMWMSRSEFDREACFYAVGGVRGSLEWDDFCDMELPVPSIEKQREIVREYHTIVDRIKLNEQLNQKLEETAQAIYKQWFVDFEFPVDSPPLEGCPTGGVVSLEGCPTGGVVPLEGRQAKPDGVVKRDTKAYRSLPYNPKLKDRAKALRKAGVLSEVLIWQQLHKKKFKGLDFDRQKIIGNYIVDFYCPNLNVVVEIDGSSHNDKQEYDAERDAYLKGLGLTVIRIKDIDVKRNLQGVMDYLREHEAFQMDSGDAENDCPDNKSESDHPALRAPLQRRGIGYKSSGGEMVWNDELGQEIPKGWNDGNFLDHAKIIMGQSPKGDTYNYDGVGTPLINGPVEFGDYYTLKMKWTDSPTKLCDVGDLIVCVRGSTTGRFVKSDDKYCLGRGVCSFQGKISQYFVDLLYKAKLTEMLTLTTGSTFPNWGRDTLSEFSVIVPINQVVLQFDLIISKVINRIETASKESIALGKLKDLLLQKMTNVEAMA